MTDTTLPCPVCKGRGEEYSGVCHCGVTMDGHSLYDNHTATEMTRRCYCCDGSCMLDDAAVLRFLDANSCYIERIDPPSAFPSPIVGWVIWHRKPEDGMILGAGRTLRDAVVRWMQRGACRIE